MVDVLEKEGQLPASLPVSSLLASLACLQEDSDETAYQGSWTLEHHRLWENRCRRHLAEQSKLKRVPEGTSISDLQLSGLTWVPPGSRSGLFPAPGPEPQFARLPQGSPPPWGPARSTCPPSSLSSSTQKESRLISARQESSRPKWPSSASASASLPKQTRMILSALEGSPSRARLSSPPRTPASSRAVAQRGKAGSQPAYDACVDRELSRLCVQDLNGEPGQVHRGPSLLAKGPAHDSSSSMERQQKVSLSVRETSFSYTPSSSSASCSPSSSVIQSETGPGSQAEKQSLSTTNQVTVRPQNSDAARQDLQTSRREKGSTDASAFVSCGPCAVNSSTAVSECPPLLKSETTPRIPDAVKPVSGQSGSVSSTRSQTTQTSTRSRQLSSLTQAALASTVFSPSQMNSVLDPLPSFRHGLGSRQGAVLSSGDVTPRRRLPQEEVGKDARGPGRRRNMADPTDVALSLGLGYRAASLVGTMRAPSSSEEKQRSRLSKTLGRDPVLSSLVNSVDPSWFDADIPSRSGDVSYSRQDPLSPRHERHPLLSQRSLPDADLSAVVSSKTSSIQLSMVSYPHASISTDSHPPNDDILNGTRSLAADIGLCSSTELSQLQASAKSTQAWKGVSTFSKALDTVDGCAEAGGTCCEREGEGGDEPVSVAGREDEAQHDELEGKSCKLAITNLTPFSPLPLFPSPQQHAHAKKDGHPGFRPPPNQTSIAKAVPSAFDLSFPFDCSIVGRSMGPQGEEDEDEEKDHVDPNKDSGRNFKSASAAVSSGHLRTGLAIFAPTAPSIGSRHAGSFCRDLVLEAASLGVSDGRRSSELVEHNLEDDQGSTQCFACDKSRRRKDCQEPPLGIYGDAVTEPPSVTLLDKNRERRRVRSSNVSSPSKPSCGDLRPGTTRHAHATVRRSGSKKILSIQMPSVFDNYMQRDDTVASALALDYNHPDGKAHPSDEDRRGTSCGRRNFKRFANQDISAFSRNFEAQAGSSASDAFIPRATSVDSGSTVTQEGGSAVAGKAPGRPGPTPGVKLSRRGPEFPGEKSLPRKQDREAFCLWRLAHLPMPPHPVLPSRSYTFILPCRRSDEESA